MNIDLTELQRELPNKRWFGDKSRAVTSVTLVDHGILDERDGSTLILGLAEVAFSEGPTALYSLPLVVEADGRAWDATDDPERFRVLGDMLAHGHPIKSEHGIFHFSGPGLDPGNPPGAGSIRKIDGEQSNTSIVFDDSVILKFFRKVEPGPNPDLELTRVLTNEGFRSIPEQVGEIFYEPTADEEVVPEETPEPSIDLGIAQRFVHGGREGWVIALEHVGQLLDQIHEADVPEDRPLLVEERSAEILAALEQLGDATATMHVTLAREDMEAELRPEPVTPEDLEHWSKDAIRLLNTTVAASEQLRERNDQIKRMLERLPGIESAGSRIRIHGDYHLGQVLRVPRLWYILDFEGEPARSLEDRRAKQSPLKDVAGMLRSLSYAAHASLFDRCGPDDEQWARLEPWALAWEEAARDRFLSSYLAKSHEGMFLPNDEDSILDLLDFFELEKAIYEVGYELGARPEWVRIPLRGIERILERGEKL